MFDEQPDGDIHGECAAEIHSLQDQLTRYRAVMEQAVEALESLWIDREMLSMEDHDEALTALREALKEGK